MEKMAYLAEASKPEPPPASLTIGIDVSKDHLDAARHPGGDTAGVANTRKGQSALLRWIGDVKAVARVVFEPTGPYHRALEERLASCGVPMVKVNCLVPGFDGAFFSLEWKEALWARFTTEAPRRQRQSVE
ncbi:hypothetical protein [Acidomonas methanolica]|uniref:hypothetical protein n=1 Tax=Acidomonas methanolica TaxID=437 RepID=UPI00211A1DC1|nr:hypothetical protein [Acidomonas methanolica]MCQ9155953.1 hypothetical protein [Acidomonas methanolica]